jgi:hypothetical protein
VEIPKQEKQETVPAFVMRACTIMEKTQKSEQKTPQKLSEEAAEKKERLERLDPMTTQQVEHENTQMINDLYRLLKKYQGLRNLIRELKVSFRFLIDIISLIDAVGKGLGYFTLFISRYFQSEYGSSKMYPIFPRYTMLKDMIKDVMHDPR